jgi:hypothetical protein
MGTHNLLRDFSLPTQALNFFNHRQALSVSDKLLKPEEPAGHLPALFV